MSILEGELANEIADALDSAGVAYAIAITREVPGEGGDPFDPPPPVVTTYNGRGFVDDWDEAFLTGGLVERGDVKVIVIANSIAVVPAAGDRVTARGKTYSVLNVSADPARATFTLQARS